MGCACSAAGSAASSASPEDVARTEHGQGRVLDRWNGRAGDLARVSRTFVEAKGDLETLDRDAFVKLFDLHDFPAVRHVLRRVGRNADVKRQSRSCQAQHSYAAAAEALQRHACRSPQQNTTVLPALAGGCGCSLPRL